MIRIIGPKLIGIITLLVAINIALLSIWYFWTTPMTAQAKIDLSVINSEISKLRASIANIKDELKYYDDNKVKFDKLIEKTGYTTERDRTSIAKSLNELRQKSLIQELEYDISDTLEIENQLAKKAKYQLVKRRIDLKNIKAFFDTDIYKFIYAINNDFKGHTRIVSTELRRRPVEEFNKILDNITNKEKDYMIVGNISFEWYALLKLPGEEALPTVPQ